jgi:hypothetical protein
MDELPGLLWLRKGRLGLRDSEKAFYADPSGDICGACGIEGELRHLAADAGEGHCPGSEPRLGGCRSVELSDADRAGAAGSTAPARP